MTKIVNNKGQYKLTLPKDLVLDKGWKAGNRVRFIEDELGNVILKVLAEEKRGKNG